MEQATENRLSLYGVKIIHDHLIIVAVSFAGHKKKFIFFIAEMNVLKCPVQLLKFGLGIFHILLKLGKELLPELFLGGESRVFHLFLIAEQLRVFQLAVFRLEPSSVAAPPKSWAVLYSTMLFVMDSVHLAMVV